MLPTLGPTRLQLCPDLSSPITGAWLPYTAHISDELPALQAAVVGRLGPISGIEVNWRDFRRFPGLDSEYSALTLPLMVITATYASATLLVIPPRTASPLAAALLRRAGQLDPTTRAEHSHLARRATRILSLAAQQTGAAPVHTGGGADTPNS